MEEMITANILIGDRTYRLKVASVDEGKLRNTVKLINEKVLEYKTLFAGKDMQDYISMALLWFATEQNKTGEAAIQMKSVSASLHNLQAQIEKALKSDS
ncbi:MAG: cell division protein ZapA [Bacteroidetes bacterium]|nr:cell division protein ZapA [Bacteroidota bacterium]